MKRIYEAVIQNHLQRYDQMIFLTGPRQVGKTTLVKSLRSEDNHIYLNWDNLNDKKTIISGYDEIVAPLNLEKLTTIKPILILDEIHKMSDWKNFLTGVSLFLESLRHIHAVVMLKIATLV
ncbi:MAG: AAA family ATPase [Candidatus Staskawiczbacteria bacterium]|nr:AAA family ATPase [Candidatus Staskawiczbacteria bacterium]